MKTLRRTISDGVQSLYDVDFDLGYFERGHIYVYAGDDHTLFNTQLSYMWQNDTQIELTVPEEYTAGTIINIRRIVPRDVLYVTFKNSTGLTEKSLNSGNAQALMLLEEQDDGFKPEGFYEKQDLLFGGIYTCKELRDGVDPQDAVTMKQVFDVDEGYLAGFVTACTTQANRSEEEADRAFSEANRAEAAADSTPDITTLVTKDSATGAASMPTGTTAQRPGVPSEGMLRRNSETGALEEYTGSAWANVVGWVGTPPTQVETANFTATIGEFNHLVNVTAAPLTATIVSASPVAGELVYIGDYNGDCAKDNLITVTSAHNINGSANDYYIKTAFGCRVFQYVDATVGYRVVDGFYQNAGAITTIWEGIADHGVAVDWLATEYTLSQFDAILLRGKRNTRGVSTVARPSDLLANGAVVFSGAVNTSNMISLDVITVTDTSLSVDITTTGYTGELTGIYGINFK